MANCVQQQATPAQQATPVHQGQQMPQNLGPQETNSQLYAPISAHIPRYCFAEDKYWFVIEAALEDGRHWELSRYYEDFYDFQIALLTEFPAEAGNTGTQTRTLPYMPGPVNYVTDAITDGRRHNLDAYVKNLLTQPPYISRCSLVKQFFAPREGDFEIDPSAEYEGSQPSSAGTPPDGASRQSSRGNLNGNGYGGLSAAPARQGNNNGGQPQYPAGPTRQISSLSQPSQTSLQNGVNPQAPLSAMKVKIYFGDDLFAIRVPRDVTYQALYEKIRERLKINPGDEIAMYYRDDSSGERPSLMSNNDLEFALQRNDKLVIIVEYN
jgi:bud emergence protein 1